MFCAICGDEITEAGDLCAGCQQEQVSDRVPVAAGNATTATAQPGWYADPTDAARQRYWNGKAWASTSHPANSFAYATAAPLAPVAVPAMSFPQAVKSVLTHYVGFSGRARRSEFWWFTLFTNLVSLVVFFCVFAVALIIAAGKAGATAEEMAVAIEGANTLALGISFPLILAVLLPAVAVTIRRLHDTNRSGWFYLLELVPLVGGIMLLVILTEDSTRGPNLYGPSPKYV